MARILVKSALAGAVLSLVALAHPAFAGPSPITMSVTPFGASGFGPAAGSTVITFDDPLPGGVVIDNAGSNSAGLFTGLTPGIAAPPFGDATKYYSTGVGTTTISFPGFNTYLGLEWGSVDPYNTLKLFNGTTLLGSFTGTDIEAGANGDQLANGTFYVNFAVPEEYTSIELISTNFSFEVDNIAFIDPPGPVPEPASLALFAASLGGVGFLRRRRKAA